jgi:hypothetical protein
VATVLHGYLGDIPPAEYEAAYYLPSTKPAIGLDPLVQDSIRPRAVQKEAKPPRSGRFFTNLENVPKRC